MEVRSYAAHSLIPRLLHPKSVVTQFSSSPAQNMKQNLRDKHIAESIDAEINNIPLRCRTQLAEPKAMKLKRQKYKSLPRNCKCSFNTIDPEQISINGSNEKTVTRNRRQFSLMNNSNFGKKGGKQSRRGAEELEKIILRSEIACKILRLQSETARKAMIRPECIGFSNNKNKQFSSFINYFIKPANLRSNGRNKIRLKPINRTFDGGAAEIPSINQCLSAEEYGKKISENLRIKNY